MKSMINTEHIEGRIYQHDLAVKTVQNQNSANYGKEFIGGTLDVAVDEDGLNVLQIHFTYVTEMTGKGSKSGTFAALKKIIDEGKVWITDGKDVATKVKIDTALALNDFYAQDGSLVSLKINEGGFVNIVTDLTENLEERNTFTTDMLITSINHIEANPEKSIDKDYTSVRGAIFNFRGVILPVEFVVKNDIGMKYFESLDVSDASPLFTKVWGKINSTTVTIEKVEESAFGQPAVRSTERKTKEWVITGAAKIPYDFGDPVVLTEADIDKAMQDRELYLADRKKSADEWRANKQTGNTASAFGSGTSVAPAPTSGKKFNF